MAKRVKVTLRITGEYEDYVSLDLSYSEYKFLQKIINLINIEAYHIHVEFADYKIYEI